MPVARYSACQIAWYIWEQPVVAVSGIVTIAAMVRRGTTNAFSVFLSRHLHVVILRFVKPIRQENADLLPACFVHAGPALHSPLDACCLVAPDDVGPVSPLDARLASPNDFLA